MFKVKRARSVLHSLAHHGVSALSYLHPRLGEECKKGGVSEIKYNLLTGKICDQNITVSNQTERAFIALKENFERIAKTEGINSDQLIRASIVFGFMKGQWPNYCICSVESKDDKIVKIKVDGFGKKYNALRQYKNYS